MNLPPPKERQPLVTLLADLQGAVEDLLLTGLAAASDGTRQTLSTSFQAASRMKLLRLGFTLRVATEEIGRFAQNDPQFSRRRYGFFLGRAWMLSRGLRKALEEENAERWAELTRTSESQDLPETRVVTLGVGKRVVPGAFVAFDFRLRQIEDGRPLSWSAVFPLRPGVDVPPEAYLHLPQPQGFKAAAFQTGRVAKVTGAKVNDEGRLTLAKDATVEEVEEPFEDWDRLLTWDKRKTVERVKAHKPGPFDLEVELQEEVVLRDFRAGKPEEVPRERLLRYPIETKEGLPFHVLAGSDKEDERLRDMVGKWTRWQKGPLFGIVHYEMCRFVLQPLTLFGKEGPESLHLEGKSYDAAGLVKALRFT